MAGGVEGERPHVERTAEQPRQPEQTQPAQGRSEGRASLQGPTTLDGAAQGDSESTRVQKPHMEGREHQPLPSVWDYLERFTRFHAPDVGDCPRWGTREYRREADELKRLERELREKGTARDDLIHTLYTEITVEPTGTLPVPVDFRDLTLEEFRQFRSQVEPLSERV
jgi:hypothetical protein